MRAPAFLCEAPGKIRPMTSSFSLAILTAGWRLPLALSPRLFFLPKLALLGNRLKGSQWGAGEGDPILRGLALGPIPKFRSPAGDIPRVLTPASLCLSGQYQVVLTL